MKISNFARKHPALFVYVILYFSWFCANIHFGQISPHWLENRHLRRLKIDPIDFDQIYAGGVAADRMLWDSMYPAGMVPYEIPWSFPNKEPLRNFLDEIGAKQRTKWIYLPHLSLFFVPLAKMPYDVSVNVFLIINMFAGFFLLRLVERFCEKCGWKFITTQLFILALSLSFGFSEAIRCGNIVTFAAIANALIIDDLCFNNSQCRSAFGFAISGLTKGYSAFWLPVVIEKKRWMTIYVGIAIAMVLFLVGCIYGLPLKLYSEYASDVLPAAHGVTYRLRYWNQTLSSFFGYVLYHPHPGFGFLSRPHPNCVVAMDAIFPKLQFFLFVVALIVMFVKRNSRARILFMSFSLLIFNLLGSINWRYYSTELMPFIPFLVVFARNKMSKICLYVGLVVYMFFPWSVLADVLNIKSIKYILQYAPVLGLMTLSIWHFVALVTTPNKSNGQRIFPTSQKESRIQLSSAIPAPEQGGEQDKGSLTGCNPRRCDE